VQCCASKLKQPNKLILFAVSSKTYFHTNLRLLCLISLAPLGDGQVAGTVTADKGSRKRGEKNPLLDLKRQV
jgi:hypothetical protein